MIETASCFCVDLESAAAVSTDVVKAALGLTGIDDVAAAAMRTADEIFECCRHTKMLPQHTQLEGTALGN